MKSHWSTFQTPEPCSCATMTGEQHADIDDVSESTTKTNLAVVCPSGVAVVAQPPARAAHLCVCVSPDAAQRSAAGFHQSLRSSGPDALPAGPPCPSWRTCALGPTTRPRQCAFKRRGRALRVRCENFLDRRNPSFTLDKWLAGCRSSRGEEKIQQLQQIQQLQ